MREPLGYDGENGVERGREEEEEKEEGDVEVGEQGSGIWEARSKLAAPA